MTNINYVKSNFERKKGDNYKTIDKRCVHGFLKHYRPVGQCIDVCAPDGSAITDELDSLGFYATNASDAFLDNIKSEWIITNPPYMRGLVDKIILRQIERVRSLKVFGLAVLLRSNFDYAKTRANMFSECDLYSSQIKLCFRPWWSDDHEHQPIHNFTWHIWLANNHGRSPIVLYSNGELWD